jgi:hypothetical protein
MSSFPRVLRFLFIPSLAAAVTVGVVAVVGAAAPEVSYRHVGTLPAIVNGDGFSSIRFDPKSGRLFATSRQGLYWTEPGAPDLRWKGPLVSKRLVGLEIASDLGRVFYSTIDEVGYVDLEGDPQPVRLTSGSFTTADMAYDAASRRLYVSEYRSPRILAFDAANGERAPDLQVPGWWARQLEAANGRVFFQAAGKDGLFVIDTRAHTVAPWPVTGPLITPAYLDADPSGRYLFATYDRYVVAIDVATSTVIERIIAPSGAAIAWDPAGERLLVNWANASEQPRIRVQSYRVDADGLTKEVELTNPDVGAVGLEPTANGFVQRGYRTLLLWEVAR